MECERCKTQLPVEAAYCLTCGLPQIQGVQPPGMRREIEAALSRLKGDETLSLHGFLLRGEDLSRLDLPGADFSACQLEAAKLNYVNLKGANLQGANLSKVYSWSANLEDANLRFAYLKDAYFMGANLKRARLFEANLIGAQLKNVQLYEAQLVGADLTNATISGALRGANFDNAILTNVQLHHSRYDSQTNWPDDFDPEAVGARRAG